MDTTGSHIQGYGQQPGAPYGIMSVTFENDEERNINITINAPPTALAGRDKIVERLGEPVTLNAGMSFDPDNDNLTYSWEQVEGPQVILSGEHTPNMTFTPQEEGRLCFQVECLG
jgi:hypothetical protein